MSDSSKITNNSDNKNECWKLENTIRAVCKIFREIIDENKEVDSNEKIFESQKKMIFYLRKPPSIDLLLYIERIIKYTHLEESTLIYALIYIDRVCQKSDILLSENNIHSVVLAIKYNEDDFYSINYYAKIGGVSQLEAFKLEYEFINLTDFQLFVTRELYDRYHEYLLQYRVKT